MKKFIAAAALGVATSAFAVAPFNQSSVTMPDGSRLVKKCDQDEEPTRYKLEIERRDNRISTIEVEARPNCPATIVALDDEDNNLLLHIVLGFTGEDRSQTVFAVGDTNHDLSQVNWMNLAQGQTRTAAWEGVVYHVTRTH